MRRTRCPAYPTPDGRKGQHRWEKRCVSCGKLHNESSKKPCKEDWQWQLVCACGQMASEDVYGHPSSAPPEVQEKQDYRKLDLDSPADLATIVEALFDSNLDWAEAVRTLQPQLNPNAIHALADEWQADARVQAAVEAYVKRLEDDSSQRTWLRHLSQKLSTDEGQTGAVRATALNILKAMLVVEKSEQEHTHIRIEGMEDMRKGFGSATSAPAESDKELLN